MSLGSIFIGLAIAVMVIAYIARPFRAASGAAVSRTDKLIEAWVRAAPVATPAGQDAGAEPRAQADVIAPVSASVATPPVAPAPVVVPRAAARSVSSEAVNFCPQCGRRVTAEYRFCPGCGALLPHEEGAPSGGAA